jgi:hypothetical protein
MQESLSENCFRILVTVVVEEAAEVLEAHIVTSMSSSCEHLILIGKFEYLCLNLCICDFLIIWWIQAIINNCDLQRRCIH